MALRWTPFECWPCAKQTAAGLLHLEESEVEVLQRSYVQLQAASPNAKTEPWGPPLSSSDPSSSSTPQVDAATASKAQWIDRTDPDLVLQLTTRRLVLWWQGPSSSQSQQQQPSPRIARYLHLSHLLQVSLEDQSASQFFGSKRKILLNTYMGDVWLVMLNSQSPVETLEAIRSVLRRKDWTHAEASHTVEGQAQRLTRHKVGVDAILSKSHLKHQRAQALTNQAVAAQDAETLIQEATELTKAIRKCVATLERNNNNNNAATETDSTTTNDGTASDAQAQKELIRLLQDMGMTSALSKKDTHNYYETIARQLADLLLPRLPKVGGVMTLTDVYCLLNRSRSAHLLSPDDLWQAAQVLDTLHLGVSTRTFPSGLVVIQETKWNDSERAELLRDACGTDGCTPSEAARIWHTTPLLVREQLYDAERLGYLVRDEPPNGSGIRFYPNRFDEWWSSTTAA